MEGLISFWGYKEQESNLILPEHDDDDDDDDEQNFYMYYYKQGKPNKIKFYIIKNWNIMQSLCASVQHQNTLQWLHEIEVQH